MKKLAILLIFFFLQTTIYSQTEKYSFNVEIRGKGKPIILIPGLASSGKVWKQTTDTLKKNYECHILTLAGFAGQKPISLKKGYYPIIQKEIISYIKNELNEKPILIGHSFSGFLSLSIASSQPNLLQKLIIVDSYPFLPSAYNPNINETNILPQANQMKSTILKTTNSLFAKQQKVKLYSMITDTINVKLATKWALESNRETIAQATFEMMTKDLTQTIATIKTDVLVLGSWYGLKDYGISQDMVKNAFESQYSKVKNCKIKIAEKAKHFIMWDEPNWTFEQINLFISGNE
ncbi:alpha/beta fold hydrolase [Aquimarina macrocephali]|uniref:alpha/beta fold hydrolase n=1 Tax=Aquimarina macrocephali TaxID=666563 RepID=UPI003F670D70